MGESKEGRLGIEFPDTLDVLSFFEDDDIGLMRILDQEHAPDQKPVPVLEQIFQIPVETSRAESDLLVPKERRVIGKGRQGLSCKEGLRLFLDPAHRLLLPSLLPDAAGDIDAVAVDEGISLHRIGKGKTLFQKQFLEDFHRHQSIVVRTMVGESGKSEQLHQRVQPAIVLALEEGLVQLLDVDIFKVEKGKAISLAGIVQKADVLMDAKTEIKGIRQLEQPFYLFVIIWKSMGITETGEGIAKLDAFTFLGIAQKKRGIGIDKDVLLLEDMEVLVGPDIAEGTDLSLAVKAVGALGIEKQVVHAYILFSVGT